ncbi:MAG: molecular chaperone TorD family protein [Helicobacteraceae bacterium]|jgi:TorA maturation chaperone TorD|nr:molecular chaperone TorD family protein [Helicobacteraceae bacterium]
MTDKLNEARSVCYGVLSLLFIYRAASRKPQDTIALLKAIESSDFDDEARKSAQALAARLEAGGGFEALDEEFSTLFLIPFGETTPMNASVYYDDTEASKPLLIVKEVLAASGLRKESGRFGDNEDNFGFVFTLMSRLCRAGGEALEGAKRLYFEIIRPFAPQFLKRLKKNKNISLYNLSVNLTERFLAFEEEFHASLRQSGTHIDREESK